MGGEANSSHCTCMPYDCNIASCEYSGEHRGLIPVDIGYSMPPTRPVLSHAGPNCSLSTFVVLGDSYV